MCNTALLYKRGKKTEKLSRKMIYLFMKYCKQLKYHFKSKFHITNIYVNFVKRNLQKEYIQHNVIYAMFKNTQTNGT